MISKKLIRSFLGLEKLGNILERVTIDYAADDKKADFSIRLIENGRIANNGVILKNWRVVKSSIIYKDRFDKYNKIKFISKYALPSFPFSSKKKTYISIADEWCKNYCHWTFEALSRLVVLKEKCPESILVLPKSYLKIEFVVKTLEAFKIRPKDILTIKKNCNLKFAKLFFVPCTNNEVDIFSTLGYFDFLRFKEIKNQILSYYKSSKGINFGERIYISRNCKSRKNIRQVVNEAEAEELLGKYGFKTVYMENLSFVEQISVASNAKFIVAVHGAGMANAMFMKENGAILEMATKDWNGSNCFGEMAKRLDLKFISQICDSAQKTKPIASDVIVNIAELEKNLTLLLVS